ncbi:MAG: hypothetical protein IJD70_06225 [Clostridia bacterium]|nr:hypothetical protein [Clostridia bacterium]
MKKIKITCILLALSMLAGILIGCAKKKEDKPYMSLSTVLSFADQARDMDLRFFSQFEYVVLGSSELPLYYFQLKEIDFSFSIGLDADGMIESMMLSHSSGQEIYLFHKNPGQLDPNATQYTEDAKSYDLQKFIDKMTED